MTKNVVEATEQYYNNGGVWKTTAAAPASGTISIVGTGFGTHALDFEFLGDPTGHLETTAVGNDINFGSWILDTNEQVEIVSDAARGNVWYADLAGGTAAPMRFDRGLGNEIPASDKVYISWRTKRVVNAGTGQWKMFRMAALNDIQDQGTEMTMFNWNGHGNPNTMSLRPEATEVGGNTVSVFGADANYPQTDDQWYRMEMILSTSAQGTKDGACEVWRHDDTSVPVETSWNFSSEPTPKYPTVMSYNTASRFRWFLWQNYRGNGITDMEVWMDDPYIQYGTFKRVELCNNATYSSATIREIQRITSWSDTLVEAELNVGAFTTGTYYAHVIDESGASIGSQSVAVA